MNERRAHQRDRFNASVLVRTEGFSDTAEVVDMGQGGARLQWNCRQLHEGARLTLMVQSSPFSFSRFEARVLQVTNGTVRLQFEEELEQELVCQIERAAA